MNAEMPRWGVGQQAGCCAQRAVRLGRKWAGVGQWHLRLEGEPFYQIEAVGTNCNPVVTRLLSAGLVPGTVGAPAPATQRRCAVGVHVLRVLLKKIWRWRRFNFERLQREVVLNRQPLIAPMRLELSPLEEMVIRCVSPWGRRGVGEAGERACVWRVFGGKQGRWAEPGSRMPAPLFGGTRYKSRIERHQRLSVAYATYLV